MHASGGKAIDPGDISIVAMDFSLLFDNPAVAMVLLFYAMVTVQKLWRTDFFITVFLTCNHLRASQSNHYSSSCSKFMSSQKTATSGMPPGFFS